MTNLDDLPPLREVIAEHGLAANKALGQNFLLDQNITDKIVRSVSDISSKNVIEIGPGPGGLTRSLLRAGAKNVVAVEFDGRAVGALQGLKGASGGRLEVVEADALAVDVSTLVDGPRVIVANLPYNIATPLLLGWLKQIRADINAFDEMVLMFQKEVGDRILGASGTKVYGRLSVISQWICDCRRVYDLPPSAFVPPPKIKSSVVRFVPKALEVGAPEFGAVEAVTAAGFGQRRKMIRSSMKDYAAAIEACGLDECLRAENLRVEDYVQLAGI